MTIFLIKVYSDTIQAAFPCSAIRQGVVTICRINRLDLVAGRFQWSHRKYFIPVLFSLLTVVTAYAESVDSKKPALPKGTHFSITPQLVITPDDLALFAPTYPFNLYIPSFTLGMHIPHRKHYVINAVTAYLKILKKPEIDVTYFPREGKAISESSCFGIYYTFLYEWDFFSVLSLAVGGNFGYRKTKAVWMDQWNNSQTTISFYDKFRFEAGGPATQIGIGYRNVRLTLRGQLCFGNYSCSEKYFKFDPATGTWIPHLPYDTDPLFGSVDREENSIRHAGFSLVPELDMGIRILW
jgi:hypothetical protein